MIDLDHAPIEPFTVNDKVRFIKTSGFDRETGIVISCTRGESGWMVEVNTATFGKMSIRASMLIWENPPPLDRKKKK
jgi:hypothetical protein